MGRRHRRIKSRAPGASDRGSCAAAEGVSNWSDDSIGDGVYGPFAGGSPGARLTGATDTGQTSADPCDVFFECSRCCRSGCCFSSWSRGAPPRSGSTGPPRAQGREPWAGYSPSCRSRSSPSGARSGAAFRSFSSSSPSSTAGGVATRHGTTATGSPTWRFLANGHLDEFLYEHGGIDTALPLPELRAKSLIDTRARAADKDPKFSARIRDGLPPRPSPTAD